MARVSNTLIGKASGSIGNATFSSWKGINVLKEKASSVANPKTDKQLMRRSALSQMVAIFRVISAVASLGFKKLAVKKSAFNAFVGNSLKTAFDYTLPPAASLVMANLLVSKGTITSTTITSIVADRSENTIEVNYAATIDGPGQSLADKPVIVMYNQNLDVWAQGLPDQLRSTGTAFTDLPATWNTGDSLNVFVGFYNEDSGESSDSVHGTTVIVA